MTPHLAASPPPYVPRDPSTTVLYHVVADHLGTFLASLDADTDAKGLPAYVQRELYDYLQCGILAHDFLRLGCDTCHKELLLQFSCKRRGFCPSCAGAKRVTSATCEQRRMPPRPPPTWLRGSSPGCQYANGSCRCLSPATASAEGGAQRVFNGAPSPCGIGWPRPRISR